MDQTRVRGSEVRDGEKEESAESGSRGGMSGVLCILGNCASDKRAEDAADGGASRKCGEGDRARSRWRECVRKDAELGNACKDACKNACSGRTAAGMVAAPPAP